MAEVHLLVILFSDWCKAFRSMEPWKFINELGDLKEQVRMVKEFLATLIDTGEDHFTQLKMVAVFQGAQFSEFFEAGLFCFGTDFNLFRRSKGVVMKKGLPLLHSVCKISNRKLLFSS